MKVPVFIIAILLSIFSCSESAVDQTTRVIKEVTFSGVGYDLGLQHGRTLKNEIDQIVNRWKDNTAQQLGRDADSVLTEFMDYANFDDAIKHWTPDLYEEVKGIADGSEKPLNEIMVLNLLDEFWVYIDNINNHHCSDLGIPSINGSPSYIAQNMDIEKYTDDYQTLVRVERNDSFPEQLILTHPGLIALNGMNEQGIGVVVNTIMQLSASSTGLPVAFAVRRLIQSTEKDDILKFIQEVNHASGQSYIIGIRGEVFNFEASANKVVRHNPDNNNKTVYHTNHPIVNDDLKTHYMAYMPGQEEDAPITATNSYIRLKAIKDRMVNNDIPGPEIVKSALRSKDDLNNPVCRNISENTSGFTFASTIMKLTEEPQLMITVGPPDESEYLLFNFKNQ